MTGVRGTDAGHRQGDEARARLGAILRHDQRSAVGSVQASLGGVLAALECQVPCLRTAGHGKSFIGREAQVPEPEHHDDDETQGYGLVRV
jgi:hypothetical protein